MDSQQSIDPAVFRETLGHYPTGAAVITAIDETGEPVGMVIGSFTSVSLDPPLVAYLPMRRSYTYSRLRTSRYFCVNVLAADQQELCRAFVSRGADKFAGVRWTPAPAGSPVLDGVVSWIECEAERELDGGDHYIVLGRVRDLAVVRPTLPLLFFQGGYGRFSLPSLTAPADPDLIEGVRMAEAVRDRLEALARDVGADCSVLAKVGDEAVFVMTAGRDGGRGGGAAVGHRIPLIPPLGAVFHADADEDEVDEWLRRGQASDRELAGFRRNVEMVRDRGYSLSLMPSARLDRVSVMNDYSAADVLPIHERRIRRMIAETALLYEPDLEAGRTYDLHSIVVPVPSPDGRTRIALRMSSLPPGADIETIDGWVDRLKSAACAARRTLEDRGLPARAATG